jgi:hypothetical protein
MSDPLPDPEPTEEEIQAWLRTPEGAAAMKTCMQDIVAGKHGQLTPEFVEMARIGVRKHEVAELVKLVRERVLAWAGRLGEEPHEWPENSRWADLRALQDECKAIMDLNAGASRALPHPVDEADGPARRTIGDDETGGGLTLTTTDP